MCRPVIYCVMFSAAACRAGKGYKRCVCRAGKFPFGDPEAANGKHGVQNMIAKIMKVCPASGDPVHCRSSPRDLALLDWQNPLPPEAVRPHVTRFDLHCE